MEFRYLIHVINIKENSSYMYFVCIGYVFFGTLVMWCKLHIMNVTHAGFTNSTTENISDSLAAVLNKV